MVESQAMTHPPTGYSLFFDDERLGRVVRTDSDFLNVCGTLTLDDRISNPRTALEQRLARFLELNRASSRLADVEHEQDVSAELEEINRQLDSYNDYIETDAWRLIDDAGAIHPILCPIVWDNGEIVWRWNLEGEE